MGAFWSCPSGGEWFASLKRMFTQPRDSNRFLFITGKMETDTLKKVLKGYYGFQPKTITEIDEVVTLMQTTFPQNDNRIIILHSLFLGPGYGTVDPVELIEGYSRRQRFQLVWFPYSLTEVDTNVLYLDALKALSDTELAHIAHTISVALSGNNVICYQNALNAFTTQFNTNPNKLPLAKACMEVLLRDTASASLIRDNWETERLIDLNSKCRQDLSDWFVLWSLGLAIRCDGIWSMVPQLLRHVSPVEYNHRIQRANLQIIPEIYLSWQIYWIRKLQLQQNDYYEPKFIRDIIVNIHNIDDEVKEEAQRVVALRNWLQHPGSTAYQMATYQNEHECSITCRMLVNTYHRNGTRRQVVTAQ